MTGAELLRRAAKEMRERAEAATPGPWESFCPGSEGFDVRKLGATDYRSRSRTVAKVRHGDFETCRADAVHIASWHPAVALAVADWLDAEAWCAEALEKLPDPPPDTLRLVMSTTDKAIALARTYLGESS